MISLFDSISGRILALFISMSLLLFIGSSFLVHYERHERFNESNIRHLHMRVEMVVHLLVGADEKKRRYIIERMSGQGWDFTLSDVPRVTRFSDDPLGKKITHKLQDSLQQTDKSAIRVKIIFDKDDQNDNKYAGSGERGRHDFEGVDISVRLPDNKWLNIWVKHFGGTPPWATKTLLLFALFLILLIGSSLFIARRMARPMILLADAADRFGLGQSLSPLVETGPREVRHTIVAFNKMQARLHRHISDRSNMLAAVSHDLRTPITSLRLRAEYISEADIREKILTTLEEMENIVSATLSFARDEAADEQARTTDLAALLQSQVDDRADLGSDASYQGPNRLIATCRPVALKRAINNLIDNALKYAGSVIVRLSVSSENIEIHFDDQGPGIPDEQLKEVLRPFFRLESSRNRETGGSGLGLALARSIIIAHGGELRLINRPEGGLRALILLPVL